MFSFPNDHHDVIAIKEWLKQQSHLPDSWDDRWIYTTLWRTHFSLEKCKNKLENYFIAKATLPQFFEDRNFTRMKRITEYINYASISDLMMPESYRLHIFSSTTTDLKNYNPLDAMKYQFMLQEAKLLSGDDGSLGDVYIADMNLSYVSYSIQHSSFIHVRKCLVCLQEAFPAKIKAVHFVNVSSLLQATVTTLKPFLKEKIRNRIFFHSDAESLQKHIPKNYLPEEYGGTAGTLSELSEKLWDSVCKYEEWFRETASFKADESKRTVISKKSEELFGVEGSFRQLNID